MLGKLMKYEIKWTGRFLLPLYIILAFFTLAGRIVISNVNMENKFIGILVFIMIIGYVFSILAISFGTFIIIMVRFYKNMMTDEGYLMFTLPAKVSTHILAKGMIASLWTVASIVLTFVSIYLLISGNEYMSETFKAGMSEMYTEIYQVFGNGLFLFIIECAVYFIVASILSVLYIYVSIAIGQLISKNKILGSVAAYIIINIIIQFVMLIGMLVISLFNIDNISNGDGAFMFRLMIPCFTVIAAGLSVVFFYITNHILSRKLNLE